MTTRISNWSYDQITFDVDGRHYKIEIGHGNPSPEYVKRIRERIWPLGNAPKTLTHDLLPRVCILSQQKGHSYEEMITIKSYPGLIEFPLEIYRNGVATNEKHLVSIYQLLRSLSPDHKEIEETQASRELQSVDPWFTLHIDSWLIPNGLKAIELLRE